MTTETERIRGCISAVYKTPVPHATNRVNGIVETVNVEIQTSCNPYVKRT